MSIDERYKIHYVRGVLVAIETPGHEPNPAILELCEKLSLPPWAVNHVITAAFRGNDVEAEIKRCTAEYERALRRENETDDYRDDDGMLDGEEFDADAGRDVLAELQYIRSGAEKRNYGC